MGKLNSDKGQALVLSLILLGAMAALIMAGLTIATKSLRDEAKAQTAADAAALAGAGSGDTAAYEAAAANGAQIINLSHQGSDTLVTVRLNKAQAKARARADLVIH